jgi:hypothetical protein
MNGLGEDEKIEKGEAWEDFRITGGNDPVRQLKQKIRASLKRTQLRLQPDEVEKRLHEKRNTLSDWEAGLWRDVVPRKRLLRLLVAQLGGGLSYDGLRSLILAEMKEDPSLWPQEFPKPNRRGD